MTESAAGITAPATTARQRLRAIFGGSIGNLIEWYDWYTYAAFAIYFAPSFFPKSNDTVQLLNTAAIFAVGFLMRPIGGWVLGRYADRHGRKAALTLSVTLMCLGSLIIAVTPTYATIGAAAPALLLIARLLQGFSVGGEYGTSATYMSEIATTGSRGFYSGILYVTLIMGQLLALAVLMVLQFVRARRAAVGSMGLAYSIRLRRGGGAGRTVSPAQSGRDRCVQEQVRCARRGPTDSAIATSA